MVYDDDKTIATATAAAVLNHSFHKPMRPSAADVLCGRAPTSHYQFEKKARFRNATASLRELIRSPSHLATGELMSSEATASLVNS